MAETNFSGLPIKIPDKKVGESFKTNVYSYEELGQVVKIENKTNGQTYQSTEDALAEIDKRKAEKKILDDLIRDNGGSNKNTPQQPSFLHQIPNQGGISIGHSQEYIQNGVTLKSLHGDLKSLSPESLRDLKAILLANLVLWKKENKLMDIVGSDAHSTIRGWGQLRRHLNPLVNSNNIMIDNNGYPRLIDQELHFGKDFKRGLNTWVSQKAQLFGIRRAIKQIDSKLRRYNSVPTHKTLPQAA